MSSFQTLTPSQLDRAAFVAAFGGIYEHSAWVAERAFDEGQPLPDAIEALHQRLSAQVARASHAEQLALIQAHPDLAGRAALAGQLTAASTSEQAGAGLDQCNADELERFTRYNDAYRAKFGFPFIMAVKGSNRHLILAAFEERLPNTPEQEFQRALAEIDRIALFRLQTL
ncbi:2-oxo-4-hydroxy-4-carboxy-5-ureidoimidazoline decarboxylase [Pseudomonas oryzihabitans]|uniref:2-oxo-4-hydroxy-4-carboxy-5-ureidoimidazoline decarboxylase n=1 Tax=Pseudomonas oryzihabitans TaxID=47885 RepID=UPI0028955C50|nr:2-oxo-4-hydroxy-4-carboxy-5-ureidoimidazoline decarboxylase [Pseudomonas oryzihabitans]MDT3718151.1 2-oxo-4-hydroxy-4-carboxy-5-ureidoimidazoline decarboxylase [Pseudomonas oryzihabitans]